MSIDTRPFKKVIYVPKNDLLRCQCIHGCEVEFVVIPYVATPKAFGECEHFKYVMLLEDNTDDEPEPIAV